MTKSDLTLIAALLDRSGSMESCQRATESGFDELIAEQRTEPGRAIVTLSMFDHVYENVYANLPIAQVGPLNLVPRGRTAMLDAIGRFITETGEHLAGLPEDDRPGTVICVIMTDGYENASEAWSYDAVHALITQQREQYNWKFIFLGANVDAVEVGSRIGVPKATSMTYRADARSVEATWAATGSAISGVRAGVPMKFTDEQRRRAEGDGA